VASEPDLKARLESLNIHFEPLDPSGGDPPYRLLTLSSFSATLLDYGAFIIDMFAGEAPEETSLQKCDNGYCLHYRLEPKSRLSEMLHI
jgi:hypothetical protein